MGEFGVWAFERLSVFSVAMYREALLREAAPLQTPLYTELWRGCCYVCQKKYVLSYPSILSSFDMFFF